MWYLQQYEDGTYGYMDIDNLNNEHGKIISEQDLIESRDEYIKRCNLTFSKNQYGSNLELDKRVNSNDCWIREAIANQCYGLDKLINDTDSVVREAVALQRYKLDILVKDKNFRVRCAVAQQRYRLDILINDEHEVVRKVARSILEKDKSLVLKYSTEVELKESLTDFIYNINDSKTLNVQSNYNSTEAFFNDDSDEAYNNNESIIIITTDTKRPIIQLEKQYQNDKKLYKFIVDITTENNDEFIVRTVIDSKEKFRSTLESVIKALKEISLFYKYVEDLENCL